MDKMQEERAHKLVRQLEDALPDCGLLLLGNQVFLRSPGSPYTDSPLLFFEEADLNNAISLGLLAKSRMIGSYNWEWYTLTYSVMKIDIAVLEGMKTSPVATHQVDDLTTEVKKVFRQGGKVIVERRYTNARPDRVHAITSAEAWNEFRQHFFGEEKH